MPFGARPIVEITTTLRGALYAASRAFTCADNTSSVGVSPGSASTTTQIVVITIESLKGEDIGILTPKWGQEWGIGQKDEDNGIVILLSKNDRKIWIAPGYGAEERLTAGVNGEIIRNIITPEFKDYKDGKLKMISFFAKKARGMMVRFIIDTNAETIDDLKGFNYEGYAFDANLSKGNSLVFTR